MWKYLSIAVLLASSPLQAQSLTFKNKGVVVKDIDVAGVNDLTKSQSITVFEPHELHNVKYSGYSINDVLDKVYGEAWRSAEEILFTCTDGFKPSVPVAQFKEHQGYLVVKRLDQATFSLVNKTQANEKIDLGPFYLVWDNIKEPQIQQDGMAFWPYQVIGIDLISFADRFPNLAPAASENANVKEGFLAYRKFCMSCHRINGEGGEKALELNYPVSVTEYFQINWLKNWIDDPQKVRYGSLMPGLDPKVKNRDMVINDIILYLKAMAKNKISPTKRK